MAAMTMKKRDLWAQPAFPIGIDDGQFWRLEDVQVINWGGFDGYHRVPFAPRLSLLTGGSEVGKSALLDSIVALVMSSRTPFNGMSNEHVKGAARGKERRNLLTYARGKTNVNRDDVSQQLLESVLRGGDGPTWTAVAATWRNEAGEQFSAARAWFVPASATSAAELVALGLTAGRAFHLNELRPFVNERFRKDRVKAGIPGIQVWAKQADYSQAVYTHLGIGRGGDGASAMQLLGRIQGGWNVATVDELFRTMVLEEPVTYAAADRSVELFDELKRSHLAMRDAEDKVNVLRRIPEYKRSLDAATEAIDRFDRFGVTVRDPDADTVFVLWSKRTHARLIDVDITANRLQRTSAESDRGRAHKQVIELDREVAENLEQQAANGGTVVAELGRRIDQLEIIQKERVAARIVLETQTAVLDVDVDSAEALRAAQGDAQTFLAGWDDASREFDAAGDGIVANGTRLTDQRNENIRQRDSLSGRDGLVPEDLHDARCQAADAMEIDPSQLPFVAELIDMDPQHEQWRSAVELALGGFAVTMLVDIAMLPELRKRINSLRLRRRIQFEGVSLHAELPGTDPASLPGRLVTADSPYAGWLVRRLVDRFNYICVENAADLERTPMALTLTGQTKNDRRGAHGGHGKPPIIGFSNTARLAELDEQIAQQLEQLTDLERQRRDVRERREALVARRDAHQAILAATWESIDGQQAVTDLSATREELKRILAASDLLSELTSRETQLRADREIARSRRVRAADAVEQLDASHGKLVDLQDDVNSIVWRMEDAATLIVHDQDTTYLDTELANVAPDITVAAFPGAANRLRDRLNTQLDDQREAQSKAAELLTVAFNRYQERWWNPNLGSDPRDSYPDYADILDDLKVQGLAEQREDFTRRVNQWSGESLVPLRGAFDESINEIEERLAPVNDILAGLPFGADSDRLHIKLRRLSSGEVDKFRKDLARLASDTTAVIDPADVDARFARLDALMDRIRSGEKNAERDRLLDVRRHVFVEAEQLDSDTGERLSVHSSLGEDSGGETQEIVAFLMGSALRYKLGDADLDRPRYRPVFLDEGFVKADSEFTQRGITAWLGLGFQMIVSAPLEKVGSIERHADIVLEVTKNSDGFAHTHAITDAVDDNNQLLDPDSP